MWAALAKATCLNYMYCPSSHGLAQHILVVQVQISVVQEGMQKLAGTCQASVAISLAKTGQRTTFRVGGGVGYKVTGKELWI